MFAKYKKAIQEENLLEFSGTVSKVVGLMIESTGPIVEIGEVCRIHSVRNNDVALTEVVGFNGDKVLLMPLGDMNGIGPGSRVVALGHQFRVDASTELLGRVVDGLGNPMDGKPRVLPEKRYQVNNDPPNPLLRQRIKEPMPLGVKAIDALLTIGKGQRVGIFAGSGVGKSTLLGMIARNTAADVNVIALVGERGREVREFIENDLGEAGLRRSVVVVATSDKPALVRVRAALVATSIAEYFRDLGKDVVLMMDSVTRFSMAQREIGLATGEPPVTRGYPPSVFAILPKLLERAGSAEKGSITGLYTVLVDGDDFNEPISDAARGILDGHIMLTRSLARKGHYPAIDIMDSASRVMPNIVTKEHLANVVKFKEIMANYNSSEDLINIGAYQQGTNPNIDLAIEKHQLFTDFLRQKTTDMEYIEESMATLAEIVN